LRAAADRRAEAVEAPVKAGTGWSDKIATMREKYPNAFRPWPKADDMRLKSMFEDGDGLKAMSETFGRQPGSIAARLKKHFGDDIALNP
jgi:hypothetical protein